MAPQRPIIVEGVPPPNRARTAPGPPAGRLTDEEREEFRRTPILIGGDEPGSGALVTRAPMTQEEWEAEFRLKRTDVERQGREMFDGDPPTSDEGS